MSKRNSEQHRKKMAGKYDPVSGSYFYVAARAAKRTNPYRLRPSVTWFAGKPWVPASINRRTGKPHEHKREIARRLAA